VVQIVHGMAEHASRYEEFAGSLAENGFAVYAADQRGHGQTAGKPENVGFVAEKDGWNILVNDQIKLTEIIKKENPGLKVFLLGHSMGTFIVRDYVFSNGKAIAGIILSGTSCDPGILAYIGKLIAKWQIKRNGYKAKSPLLDRMSFGKFNSYFKPNRTAFDWLSTNDENVDKYIADPYCGGIFSCSFFYDLIYGVKKINKFENIKKVPADLSILLISGEKDPVGNFTKGVLKVYEDYKRAQIKDLKYKFYPGLRHEILNETGKKTVYKDIMDWLNTHFSLSNQTL